VRQYTACPLLVPTYVRGGTLYVAYQLVCRCTCVPYMTPPSKYARPTLRDATTTQLPAIGRQAQRDDDARSPVGPGKRHLDCRQVAIPTQYLVVAQLKRIPLSAQLPAVTAVTAVVSTLKPLKLSPPNTSKMLKLCGK